MKIASIVGTRPNFIKVAPLSIEIRKKFDEIIIHTGQHYDYEMNKIFFDELNIPTPDYKLEIGSGLHGKQTGDMLKKIESILITEKPDYVLVFGDVNSTLAGALAASKLHIKVAHIESGLRSYDRKMPEEINRILTDHCSDLLFCPTKASIKNLKKENITKGTYLTGDVMVDTLNTNIKVAEKTSTILDDLNLTPNNYHLVTIHRAENTDNHVKLKNIVDAFYKIDNLVFPCHPRTEKSLKTFGLWNTLIKKVKVTQPVSYLDMLMLEKNANKILTDSGGVQKEAYILKTPCITLRNSTEWIETIGDNWNILVGTNTNKIIDTTNKDTGYPHQTNVFGKIGASKRIVTILEEF